MLLGVSVFRIFSDNLLPVDACPECGTVLQDWGCRGCGCERAPLPRAARPTGGDELPSIGGS